MNTLSFTPSLKTAKQLCLLLLIAASLSSLSSCKKDKEAQPGEITLQESLEALGAVQTLENITTISYKVQGETFEHEQSIPTQGSPLTSNSYSYDYFSELNERKIRKEYEKNEVHHPAYYLTTGPLVIINDRVGTFSGQVHWASYYFNEIEARSMFSSELEAHLKNHKMSNPIELLKEIISKQGLEEPTNGLLYSIDTRVARNQISLNFDFETKLPSSAIITEADFLKGDVPFEVLYKDWVEVDGLKYPTTLEYKLNNLKYKTERLTEVVLNPTLDNAMFTPEETAMSLAFNENLADQGVLHSQFYHRWEAWNIPWPEPVDDGALDLGNFDLTSFGIQSQFVSENVKIIGRPDNRLWGLAIKTSDGIVLIDSPLNQYWTRSILNSAKAAFPGEEVVSIISTHDHHDHFGGIREAAFEAGKVYISQEGKTALDQALNSSHELVPDNFANSPRTVDIQTVSDITYLDGGAIEIHKLKPTNTTATAHGEGMLVVYLPEEKALFQSDQLWNGVFMQIWDGFSPQGFTATAQIEIKNNAKYLLDYIEEKNLDVEYIIASHGGLGPFSDLERVAN